MTIKIGILILNILSILSILSIFYILTLIETQNRIIKIHLATTDRILQILGEHIPKDFIDLVRRIENLEKK